MTRDLGRLTGRTSAMAMQNSFSGSVGAGASYSVVLPLAQENIFINPHFVCADMCNLKIPCRKPMIGATSCSILYVHLLFFYRVLEKGRGYKYSPAVMIVEI